jgi:agmatinase
MNFPKYFADAESNFDKSEFVISGIPYDKTSSFRKGAAEAPEKIREASWNFETFNFENNVDIRDIKIHDYGDLNVEKLIPNNMIKEVKKHFTSIISKGKIAITIGGEHSITPGIVYAFPKDIAVLSLDAHMDYRDQYEDEKYNHACALKRISDHIDVDDIAVLGIRSAEKEEFEEAKSDKLFYKTSSDFSRQGIKDILKQTKKHLGEKSVYLTLDIDVIDPSYAPGTSTPEPFGLNPFDIVQCIRFFSPQLIGFDIVEVCPKYDNGETSILAAKIIRKTIEEIFLCRQ